MRRTVITTMIALVGAALAVGFFLLGRAAADDHARARGYAAGLHAGRAAGLREGQAQGRQEGRALQAAGAAPERLRGAVRAAFDDGYAAGANDVFGGYDGGWALSSPYLVTLRHGDGAITYRIDSRLPLREGVDYHLCPGSHAICQEPRR